MDDESPLTWCVTRQVPLAPPTAASALGRLFDERRGAAPHERAQLAGGLVVTPTPATGTLRTFLGRLSVTRWRRPLTVELELGPWSHTAAELRLRPRRPPTFGLADPYWRASTTALDTLRGDLLAQAPPEPPRHLRCAS